MSTYTNSVGQTIQPGDKVLVIAQGYNHSIRQRVGTFVGLSASGKPQARVPMRVSEWVKPDGTVVKWYPSCQQDGVTYQSREAERTQTYMRGRIYRLAF
jgi:hypothetical protein